MGPLASWLVLTSLVGGSHRSQRSIAAEVGVEGPTLTHHLNRMEVDGLVTRQRDPQNRRAHQVELTEQGHAAFRSLLGAVQIFDERLRADFTDAELLTLRQLLQRLAANAAAPIPASRGHEKRGTPMTAADTSSRNRPAYRPSWVQQRANTMLTRALGKGRGPSFMRLLTVRGRTTGTLRTTPVVPVLDGDRTWVVSPFGEVGWVRNARATRPGRAAPRRRARPPTPSASSTPREAVPVMRRYLSMPSRFFVRRTSTSPPGHRRRHRGRGPPPPGLRAHPGPMKLGISITNYSWPGGPDALAGHLVELARRVDEAGLDTLWVADHLLQMDPNASVDEPMLEAYSTLAFMAGVTRQVQLGTMVTWATIRPPALLIKTVTSLDVLSRGRAWLGVGVGYRGDEAAMTGLPFVARYADALQPLRRRQTDGDASTLRHKLDVLARSCDAVGRDPDDIEVTLSTRLGAGDTATQLADRAGHAR